MRNALLFRLGGLGDLLVAFPAIHLIRKKFPSAGLTLVCREEYGALLQKTGVVDRLVRGDSPSLLPLFSGSIAPGNELMEWLAGFDLIHFFYYQLEIPESISRFFFRKISEALGEGRSADFSFEECARLPMSPAQKKGKFVVVHPGSGSEKKCWPVWNFLEIVGRLSQKGFTGALVTGEAEKRLEPMIEEKSLPPGWSWLHSPLLMPLAGLLQEADLYLGNDSGITHLAAACGTEVVALFREELVTAWRPYGRVHLLSAGSLDEMSVDSVWESISRLFDLF